MQQQEHRLGEEEEPAPVDGIAEARDAEPCLVVLQDAVELGAGEQTLRNRGAGARRDAYPVQPVIGLIGLDPGGLRGAIGAVESLVLRRNDGGHPIFVGDADPAAVRMERNRRLLGLDVVIARIVEIAVDDTDEAFMQRRIMCRSGHAVARDIGVRIERDRGAGLVAHAVVDGEQILIVHRDGAGKDEALAIVPAQRDGMAGRKHRAACLFPLRRIVGNLEMGGRVHRPTEHREIGIARALRRQQHDFRTLGIERLAILLKPQIVEARALQEQRAVHRRRVDGDACPAQLECLLVAHMGGSRLGLRCCRVGGRLLLLLMGEKGLLRLDRLLALQLRARDEILPAEQHGGRQQHGEQEIAVFVHGSLLGWNGIEALRPAEPADGMAAQQPPAREQCPLGCAVGANRLHGIGRAGRCEAAGGRQHRRYKPFVEADRRKQHARDWRWARAVRLGHCFAFVWPSARAWAADSAVLRSSSRPSNGLVSVAVRATRT